MNNSRNGAVLPLFKDYGFIILAFPSDQFNQEPLDDEDIIVHNEAKFR